VFVFVDQPTKDLGSPNRSSAGTREPLHVSGRNQRHLLRVLRDYEAHHNEHRPHRSLGQAAPLKPLPAAVTDLDSIRLQQHNGVSGAINEYTLAA
jgi:hypothetical protein